MAMTDAEIRAIAVRWADKIYGETGKTADYHLDDLKAGVQAIDTGMNATLQQAVNAYGGSTVVKVAFVQAVNAHVPGLTSLEKALCLALWALQEVGAL